MKPGQIVILVLAIGCALLASTAALLFSGAGQEIPPAPPLERSDWVDAMLPEGEEPGLPPLENYAEITARPLFNDDRQPTPPDLDVEEGPAVDQPPDAELNVTVTGIIITPQKKLAMVVDNATQVQQRLTEGMPLEGDQSAWTLTSIEPRKLVFEGNGGGPVDVALETYTQALKGGKPPRARASQIAKQAQEKAAQVDANGRQPGADDNRAARAEEIRRRVAERRAQLREEAARRQQEQEQEDDNE